MIRPLLKLSFITAFLALYFLMLPGLLTTSTGSIFALCWGLFATISFIACTESVKPKRRPAIAPVVSTEKKPRYVLQTRLRSAH